MTAAELVRVVVRQWIVVLLGAVLTLAGGYQAISTRGEYVTAAGIYFVSPKTLNGGNAYLVDERVITVADVVAGAVNSPSVRAELRAAGVHEHYTLELFNAGTQFVALYDRPLLNLSVRGEDAEGVQRAVTLIHARVDAELERRQAQVGAPPRSRVTTQLTPANPPLLLGRGSRARAMVAVVLLGIAITLTVAVFVDDGRRRRGPRRSPPPEAELLVGGES